MSTPYGVRGCRCTWDREHDGIGWGPDTWYPSAHCPYHGLLPRDRMDTGTYQVVKLDPSDIPDDINDAPEIRERVDNLPDGSIEIVSTFPDAPNSRWPDRSTPPDGPECPPGYHSIFDPCPGGCLEDEPDDDCCLRGDCDCDVTPALLSPGGVHVRSTTEQEQDERPGILAALRRRWRGRHWVQHWWY